MAINGKLPRFLSKMNFALADYDTSFNCDWQAIAIKYVQLSFQVRNLNYWIQATHETSTMPSVSGFLSKRMENAISQHSEESLLLRHAALQYISEDGLRDILKKGFEGPVGNPALCNFYQLLAHTSHIPLDYDRVKNVFSSWL